MFKRILLCAAFVVGATYSASASTVSVGIGNSNSNAPWFNSTITRFQQVVDASLFSGISAITELSFLNRVGNTTAGVFSGNFDIYLSTTSATVGGLSLVADSNHGADKTLFASLNVAGNSFSGSSIDIVGSNFVFDASAGNLLFDIIERDPVSGTTTQMLGSRLDPNSSAIFFSTSSNSFVNAIASLDLVVTTEDLAPVPLPATGFLFLSAIAGMAWAGRRRNTASC